MVGREDKSMGKHMICVLCIYVVSGILCVFFLSISPEHIFKHLFFNAVGIL